MNSKKRFRIYSNLHLNFISNNNKLLQKLHQKKCFNSFYKKIPIIKIIFFISVFFGNTTTLSLSLSKAFPFNFVAFNFRSLFWLVTQETNSKQMRAEFSCERTNESMRSLHKLAGQTHRPINKQHRIYKFKETLVLTILINFYNFQYWFIFLQFSMDHSANLFTTHDQSYSLNNKQSCDAGVEIPDSNLDFGLFEAKMTLVSKFRANMTPD